MIDWNSPNWGQEGHNVHQAENGSWDDPKESGH